MRTDFAENDGGSVRGQPRRPSATPHRLSAPAFTLIELLAVLVILVLLLATFVPYAMSLREVSNRARCADNLRSIRIALESYGKANTVENRELLPRVRFDPTRGGVWNAFTGPDEANPFAEQSKVSANDASASLWLLVREGYAQPEWFVCPSSNGYADPMTDADGTRVVAKMRGNFRSPANLTLAIASPFSTVEEYRWNRDAYSSRFALIADQGPPADRYAVPDAVPAYNATAKLLRQLNSPNHNGEGQNVLFADGSVSFETSPYCGVGRTTAAIADGDNIYTALAARPLTDSQPPHFQAGTIGQYIGPAYRYDAMLVPAAGFVASELLPIGLPDAAPTAPESSQPAIITPTTGQATAPTTTTQP